VKRFASNLFTLVLNQAALNFATLYSAVVEAENIVIFVDILCGYTRISYIASFYQIRAYA